MEWKLITIVKTLFILLSLSCVASATTYDLNLLRKKKVEFLIEKKSIEKLQAYLEDGLREKNIPTVIVKSFNGERSRTLKFKKIINGGALEIRNLLKMKYLEYSNFSKKDPGSMAFLTKYDESIYLYYISKHLNDKSRDDETDSFSYLLMFIVNRLNFEYPKAMKIFSSINDPKLKKQYQSILKVFVKSEYQDIQDGNIPEIFKPLFK